MWSGPRNISTALMRAWGNRADTAVMDEPFYAYYLKATGEDHPVAEEVIAAGETDWRKVVEGLTGDAPGREAHFLPKTDDASSPAGDRPELAARPNELFPDPRSGGGDRFVFEKES